jgi:hypothetical protein
LSGVIEKFHYLRLGLAIVLSFIGVKMLIVIAHVEIPIVISLAVVLTVMLASVAASLIWPKEIVRATKIRLEGADPPVFILSGTGRLAHLVIYAPPPSELEGNQDLSLAESPWKTLWEIEPIGGYERARKIEDIGAVRYGVVPAGYKQNYPDNGVGPPALVRGNKYEYWFDTADAPHARNCFVIRGHRAVEVVD